MIIDKYNATEKELCTAYGYTVHGKEATYRWTYDGSGRKENCFTSIRIVKDGKEIYSRTLGNNIIFASCFEKNIDCLLWWIDRDQPDAYSIENTIQKVLIDNSSIFSYQIENRKRKEKKKEKDRQKEEDRKATEKAIDNYATEKKMDLFKVYSQYYVFKFENEKLRDTFRSATAATLEKYIDFIVQNPANKEASIVYHGDSYNNDLHSILEDIKRIA